jgi:predicted nucleotidyltransferase component of viral defense system
MFLNSVDQQLLLLIDSLSKRSDIVKHFYLAGGTGLALHLGHRTSVDIDLFTPDQFNSELYTTVITERGGQVIQAEEGGVHGVISGVKVSFLLYPYKMLQPLQLFHGIKIASIADIAAMKVVAISQRGDKKDFFDMFEILKVMSLHDLKNQFLEKFSEARINCYHILKSFFYFDDADRQPDPMSLNDTTWDQVKTFFVDNEKMLMRELVC